MLNLENKISIVRQTLLDLGPTCTLLSGGVDSSLMAYLAHEIHPKSTAAIAVSESLYGDSLDVTRLVAGYIGISLFEVSTTETQDPKYILNTSRRCAVCREVTVDQITQKLPPGFVLLSGVNASDVGELPGIEAMNNSGVRHLLKESGVTKTEVIQVAKSYGLPNWNRPPMACLSSNIPRGIMISTEQLTRLGKGLKIIHTRVPHSKNFITRVREPKPGVALVVSEQKMLDIFTTQQREDVRNQLLETGDYEVVEFGLYVHGQMN